MSAGIIVKSLLVFCAIVGLCYAEFYRFLGSHVVAKGFQS